MAEGQRNKQVRQGTHGVVSAPGDGERKGCPSLIEDRVGLTWVLVNWEVPVVKSVRS